MYHKYSNWAGNGGNCSTSYYRMNGKVNLGQVSLALAFPLNKSGMWYKGEKSPTDCEKEEWCYFHENPKKNNA